MISISLLVARAQFPFVNYDPNLPIPLPYVRFDGVPFTLTNAPPDSLGFYADYDSTISTAPEYNCDCKNKVPNWINRPATGEVLKRYKGAVSNLVLGSASTCSVMMRGYGWNDKDPGLIMTRNPPTNDIPAVLSGENLGGNLSSHVTPFVLEYSQIVQLREMCTPIKEQLGVLCAAASTPDQCMSADKMGNTTIPYAACCWVTADNAKPMFAGTTFGAAVARGCMSGPGAACVPRSDINENESPGQALVGFGTRPESCPECAWLPPYVPASVNRHFFDGRTGSVMFCVITGYPYAVPVRHLLIETSDTLFEYGELGPYNGTCLSPYLFQQFKVYPPQMLTASNSSIHYCNDAYPDAPVPMTGPAGRNFTFCHADPLDIVDRMQVCVKGGSEIIVGQQMRPRDAFEQVCSEIDRRCVLIPGDTFFGIESLNGRDLTGYTLIYLNVDISTLQLLLIASRTMDLVKETSVALSPFYTSTGELFRANGVTELHGEMVANAFCNGGYMDDRTLVALGEIIEGHRDESANVYRFQTGTTGPESEVVMDTPYTPVYISDIEITSTNLTIQGAFDIHPTEFRPAAHTGAPCPKIAVSATGFAARNVVFNRSGCTSAGALRAPIIVVGENAQRTIVSNVTVVDAESAIVFQSGPSTETRWVRGNTMDTTGTVVEGVLFVYSSGYTGNSMFVPVAFGGTNGTAVVVGSRLPLRPAVSTAETPQLKCVAQPGLNVCYKPNNTLELPSGLVLNDISTCGQGCASPKGSLDHGVTCSPVADLAPSNVTVVDSCASLTAEEFVLNETPFVDRIGMACEAVFPGLGTITSCSDRSMVESCSDIVGSIVQCDRWHDRLLVACGYKGGTVCSPLQSCGAVIADSAVALVVELKGGPKSPSTPITGDPLPQHWFFAAFAPTGSGPHTGIVYTSVAAYDNSGCVGGCVDNNTRCTPNACDRVKESTFVCLAADGAVVKPVRCSEASEFTVNFEPGGISVSPLQTVGAKSCLGIGVFPGLQFADCGHDWMFTRIDSAPGVYRISRPGAPFDCMTLWNDTVSMAPCFGCSVGESTMELSDNTAAGPTVYAVGDAPVNTVLNPVTATKVIAMGVCGGERPCTSTVEWEVDRAMTTEAVIGPGMVLGGQYAAHSPLMAVVCPGLCQSGVVYDKKKKSAAQVICEGRRCIAESGGRNQGFELGEAVYDSDNLFVGRAVVETVIIQPARGFAIAAVALQPINITELLGVWGTPYEHAIYTAPPSHAALIWASVSALFVAAGVGVLACLGVMAIQD